MRARARALTALSGIERAVDYALLVLSFFSLFLVRIDSTGQAGRCSSGNAAATEHTRAANANARTHRRLTDTQNRRRAYMENYSSQPGWANGRNDRPGKLAWLENTKDFMSNFATRPA